MTAQVRQLPAAPTEGLSTEIVRVTPKMAEAWHGKQKRNRHVNLRLVIKYAQDMAAGNWRMTGEAIKFAYDGQLIDGQHRLLAIMESGVTLPLMVIKGLHPDTQDVMDTGRARTASDALTIHGFENAHISASAAKVVIVYESGLFYVDKKRQQVTHQQVIDFVSGNHLLAFAASRAGRIARAADMPPSIACACLYMLSKVDAEAAEEFFERVADGVGLPSGSPILALRDRLHDVRRNRINLPVEARVALVFRAWNAWRGRRKIATLPLYKAGQLIPCPEPK